MSRLPPRSTVAVVGLIALAVRLLYLWQIHSSPFFDLRMGDGEAYHQWAGHIAAGDWLGGGVFYQAPLYPYLLAIIYRLFDDGVATVRLIQAFFGAAACALLATAGISLFGRRGAVAGLLLAIYPPAIFLDSLIDKTCLVTLLTTALLALIAAQSTRGWRWIVAGAVLGLLGLARENALLLAIPILLWVLYGAPRSRRAALAFAAACLLTLLPVGFRNLAAGGEFHLTTAQFGPNFYIGNHAGAGGSYEPLVLGHGNASDERDDAVRLAEQASGRKLGAGQVSIYWTRRALQFIVSQPIAWTGLMARKLALTFNAAEPSDTESQEVYAESSWLLRVLQPFDFGILLGLAVLGTALTFSRWRDLWFLYALCAAYALSVSMFYVLARYRLPIAPVLMLLAAGAFLRRPQKWMVPGAAAIAALAFAHLPLDNSKMSRATHYFAIATALSKDPQRLEDAEAFYRTALDVDPRFPAASFGLGTLMARAGRPKDAIPYYRAALESWPSYEEAHFNLAAALAATGNHDAAIPEFQEALRLRPDDADAHFALAKTLLALERPAPAADQYRKGLALQPNQAKALTGLGVALTQLGQTEDAIRQYQLALQLDPQDAAVHNSLGYTLANAGRMAEAIPEFERAVALNPADENARRNLEGARQMLSRRR